MCYTLIDAGGAVMKNELESTYSVRDKIADAVGAVVMAVTFIIMWSAAAIMDLATVGF